MRASNRLRCSSVLTSSQNLIRLMPPSIDEVLDIRAKLQKASYCSSVQNPMTCSTPARLYQLRSKITISPAAGKCCMYRCMYICDFSRSEGAGSATTRNTRGLTAR